MSSSGTTALHVDAMVGSKAHGRIKPHPSIFVAALRQLEVAPGDSAMVGDSYEDDIEGARALGMRAIFLDRDGLRPDEPDRIDTLLALPAALGLRPLARVARLPCGRPAGRARRPARVRRWPRPRPASTPARRTRPPRRTGRATRRGAAREDPRELACERLLILGVLPVRELRPLDELAEPPEELRLERPDRDEAPVRRPVDPVAGEPAGEESRDGVPAEPVRDEVVRAVRHRDCDVLPPAGALPLEEGGEDARHRAERPRREVGHLDGEAGRRVLEDAGPAEVVEVVARSLRVLRSSPKPVIEQ